MLSLLGMLATSFIICVAIGPFLIPFLHRLKFGQSIRECGPANHLKKSGTPTMGGIMMLVAIALSLAIWGDMTPTVIIAVVLTLGHAVIGFVDDYMFIMLRCMAAIRVCGCQVLTSVLIWAWVIMYWPFSF